MAATEQRGVKPLTEKEARELARLQTRWATMRATPKQVERAMELERRRRAASS